MIFLGLMLGPIAPFVRSNVKCRSEPDPVVTLLLEDWTGLLRHEAISHEAVSHEAVNGFAVRA